MDPFLLLVALALCTTAMYYLGARAVITLPIHSRYPAWLSQLANCAACSGTWYGLIVTGCYLVSGGNVAGSTSWGWLLVGAAAGMVATPKVASMMERALIDLSGEGEPRDPDDPDQG